MNDSIIVVDGIVEKVYPNAEYSVKISNGHIVRANISGKIRKKYVRIIAGNKVKLELSQYDLWKGRIIEKY